MISLLEKIRPSIIERAFYLSRRMVGPEDVSRLDKRRERAINDARRYIAKLLKLERDVGRGNSDEKEVGPKVPEPGG